MISIPGFFSIKNQKLMLNNFSYFPWRFPDQQIQIRRRQGGADEHRRRGRLGEWHHRVSGPTQLGRDRSAWGGAGRTWGGRWGYRWWIFGCEIWWRPGKTSGETLVKIWKMGKSHKKPTVCNKKRQAMDVIGFGCEVLDPCVFCWSGWISSELQAGGSTQAAKGPRKIVDLAPKQFADGVQQPCNNLDAWLEELGSLKLRSKMIQDDPMRSITHYQLSRVRYGFVVEWEFGSCLPCWLWLGGRKLLASEHFRSGWPCTFGHQPVREARYCHQRTQGRCFHCSKMWPQWFNLA